MRKIFILFCFSFALLFATSCQEYLDVENNVIPQTTAGLKPQIEKLIQQARQGDAEAYEALAVCYRDGEGVRQSDLNMMIMYMLSCRKQGRDLSECVKYLNVNHPIHLIMDVLDNSRIENASEESIEKLKSVSPADALIYDAIYALECKNDTAGAERLFNEAVEKGSDFACIMQLAMYQHLGYKDKYKYYLHEYADRFPIINIALGDLCMKDSCDGHLLQAIKYYTAADKYGMLTAGGARRLSAAYRMLEKEGKMKCDSIEMKRLTDLAQ